MPTGTLGIPLLVSAGYFSCPRCRTSLNPAVIPPSQLITAGSWLNQVTGFCNRCEHQYQAVLGLPSTTTTGAANVQGATALTVALGTGFSTVGALVCIDAASSNGGAEIVVVSSAGSSTSIPIAGTPIRAASHTAGATVQTCVLTDMNPLSPNLSGG
jgi:hypothetical protein